MKTIFALAMLAAFSAPAFANGDECEKLADDIWSCPIPVKPPAPPTCHIYAENLVCTAPVVVAAPPAPRAPTNCGWRKGKYICW